jgi:hypothetical protein
MKNSMYLQPEIVFETTFGTQFWQIKKEVVCVIDIITRGMYDEYKLSRKSMWKHVHEFSKSTVGIFVLFFILENFEKEPKYRYSEFGSICEMIMTFFFFLVCLFWFLSVLLVFGTCFLFCFVFFCFVCLMYCYRVKI